MPLRVPAARASKAGAPLAQHRRAHWQRWLNLASPGARSRPGQLFVSLSGRSISLSQTHDLSGQRVNTHTSVLFF
eukprot:SAG22_NODE_878_length_6715_cov_9.368652_2_plen_75_part_00